MGDLKLSSVLIYLDDIKIFSKKVSDHLGHLIEVFIRLRKAGLNLKAKNIIFKRQLRIFRF